MAIQCGLTIEQYWGLTYEELAIYVEAETRKENRIMRKLAWHAAQVINPHVKGRVTPGKLLGTSVSIHGMSPAEAKMVIENQQRR